MQNKTAENEKKRVLVFLGSFHPYEDAITNVIYPLLKALKRDYEVDVFTRSPKGDQPLQEDYEGFHVYRDRIYDTDEKRRKKLFRLSELRDVNLTLTDQRLIVLKRIYLWVLNLWSDEKWFNMLNRKKKWIQSFRLLARSRKYVAIITVTSPIQSQVEALKLAKCGWFRQNHILWVPYYVDPFATFLRNQKNRNFKNFLKFETEVYKYADCVFTSPELYEDNLHYPMGKYHDKTIPVQFASMKHIKEYPCPEYLDKRKINIIYTGSLFDHNVRHPDYFFMLASQLPDLFEVYIACNLSNPITDQLKKQYLDGHANIHWMGKMPIEECFALMRNGDLLVNLGNESANQTPSKIFDYIGMHRPVLSFYSIPQDTSLKYLKDYPYYLAIRNKDSVDDEDLKKLEEFGKKMKKTKIDDALIDARYHAFQSDVLAEQFRSKFNNVLNSFNQKSA